MSNTAPCEKCKSEIRTDAERCPECGYEPSAGVVGGTVAWVSLMIAMAAGLVAIASVAVLIDGNTPPETGIFGVVVFGVIAAYFGALFRHKYQKYDGGPAES